jgi:hypothetical protein
MKLILEQKDDGGVLIGIPAPNMMTALTNGGFGRLPGDAVTSDLAENESLRIEVAASMPVDRAIDNMVRSGFDADFAAKWTRAQISGGETDATALGMVALKTFPSQFDVVATEQENIPADRFFRDAWRRDPGGDKLYVDIDAARIIFSRRLIGAKGAAAKRLTDELDVLLLTGRTDQALEAQHEALIGLNLRALGAKVMAAASPEELKALWPTELVPALQ